MFLIVHTPVWDFNLDFGCCFPVGMRRQSATIRQSLGVGEAICRVLEEEEDSAVHSHRGNTLLKVGHLFGGRRIEYMSLNVYIVCQTYTFFVYSIHFL